MSQTVIRGAQILNNTVQRQDLDTSTVGQAVVTKLVQGANITLSSTGADSGTGDVTINASGSAGSPGTNAYTLTVTSPFTVPAIGATTTVTVADASWIVAGQLLYFDTAGGGAGLAGALVVQSIAGNTITVLNPVPPGPSLAANTTTTSSSFTIPATYLLVTVSVVASNWGAVGQAVLISDGTNSMYGVINTVTSNTSWIVENIGGVGYATSGTMASGALVILFEPEPFSASRGAYNEINDFEDFDGPSNTSITASNTIFGNWITRNIVGTGASVAPNSTIGVESVNLAKGVCTLSIGTTSSGTVSIQKGFGIYSNSGPIEINARVAFSAVPTSVQNTTYFFGFIDSGNLNGIFACMAYQATPNAAVWFIRMYNTGAGTDSAYVSSPAPVAYSSGSVTFFKIRLVGNSAWNTWTMWVNNIQTHANVSLTVPAPSGSNPCLTCRATKTVGTTSHTGYIDTIWFRYARMIP